MNQIESIMNSGLFSDQVFFFLIAGLLVFLIVVGAARSGRRGSGRYAGAFELLRHLGNWARFPLSLLSFFLILAVFVSAALGWGYHLHGRSLFSDPGRIILVLGGAMIGSVLLFWILYEFVWVPPDKNRYLLGTRRFFFSVVLSLPEKDRFEHVRIMGRAGTGKTTGFIFPQLIEDASGDCSSILLDVKSPEGYETIAGAWQAQGKKVILFDPFHPHCIGFEPLGSASEDLISGIEEVVYGKRNTDGDDSSIWFADQERRLFTLICQLIQGYKNRSQVCLPMVYQLVLRGLPSLQAAVTYCGNPSLQQKFEPLFINKYRLQDVLSGILNRLDLFSEPEISAAFSRPDLDLDLLFREPTLLIIASPHSNPKARLAASILLRALMMKVYDKPVRTKKDGPSLFFYLDEFYALHLPDMADFANTARSARVGIVTGLQSEEQLYRYQRHEVASIAVNTKTNIYLQGCELVTCKRLSDQLGKTLIKDKRVSRSMKRGSTTSTGYIETPLETPDTIQNLPLDQALIFSGGMRGFKVRQLSSFKTSWIRKRIGLPAKAYRPVDEPLVAPSYKDLDLPELPPEMSEGTPPATPNPDDGEILGWQ